MSYILDALRKADAERERDPARGIHAQPMTAAGERGPLHMPAWGWPRRPDWWRWPRARRCGSASRSGAGCAARGAPSPVPIAAPVPVPAPPVPTVATTVSPPAPLAPGAGAHGGQNGRKNGSAPPMPRANAAATPWRSRPCRAGCAGCSCRSFRLATPAAPAADRIFALAELPAEVQRDLPKLTISGGVHSENAAQRMLIVGGQVLGEGAEVAPGVTLEQIRPRCGAALPRLSLQPRLLIPARATSTCVAAPSARDSTGRIASTARAGPAMRVNPRTAASVASAVGSGMKPNTSACAQGWSASGASKG